MAPSEIALLGQSRAFVSYNSAMAARRGVAPPIQALEAAGCTIAMGSDNMAEDMVEVMRTGLFVERVARQDALRPQPEDVLEWATRHGARALGWGDEIGTLEVGKQGRSLPHQCPAPPPRAGPAHRVGLRPQRPGGRRRVGDGRRAGG